MKRPKGKPVSGRSRKTSDQSHRVLVPIDEASEDETEQVCGHSIQVLARATQILRALKCDGSERCRGLNIGEITLRVGLPRSTIQRILTALQVEGLVANAGRRGRYVLGPEMHALARAAHIPTEEIVSPFLQSLAVQTGETIELARLAANQLLVIEQFPGTHRLSTVALVGAELPLASSASGKACLASMTPEKALTLIEAGTDMSDRSRTAALLREIDQVRENGVVIDVEHCTSGIAWVSAAFPDPKGAIYAITVSLPAQRFESSHQSIVSSLKQTIRNLQMTLGT